MSRPVPGVPMSVHGTKLGDMTSPLSCPEGHLLGAGRVLVGWYPCQCPGARNGGHRTWTCRACLDDGKGDDATIFDSRHDPAGA